ncbi:2-C-methyl-D-erythritol 2,4-cyclodiphosphate synthase [Rickettsiales endosymbiont of Peranema trichophorum]|uniref:2-C-methyl-D-erythritol 2,4-cyclodiphosphate synthase n=1 Tax=Rickettsiales endosymbiont of Peranema trichophorum TaxID=2486577 RepID=UPI0010233BC6|nr:2-C-methyl-D-erythritol 2,4-cyclodiphosphate synthase [Rickettsiales endosymbiont of Peranema trichophorum]RZI47457.1 2-C-methyl-D-erythritol 2,4-cyclodiphosphate synthase [Rickettsiales endosymbiont of Peranema trichophorum]
MTNIALILAAGNGTRMNCTVPKQYIRIRNVPLLRYSVLTFLAHPDIDHVQVVIDENHVASYTSALDGLQVLPYVCGGKDRQNSARLGLMGIEKYKPIKVLIHDAARPLVDLQLISKVLNQLRDFCAVDTVVEVADTMKLKEKLHVVNRDDYYLSQTPQGFHYPVILDLHQNAFSNCIESFTDDISLCIKYGMDVGTVLGNHTNMKVTNVKDVRYIEALVDAKYINRVGHGFDIHKFAENDQGHDGNVIMLCNVEVPCRRSVVAHSDGDVGLHALIDSLLGAMGLGDIGTLFPDTNEKYKGADSSLLLLEVYQLLKQKGGYVNNIDITIITESPKLINYKHLMTQRIVELLNLEPGQVNVKAKTSETLGCIGREEGLAATAVCSIMLPQEVF